MTPTPDIEELIAAWKVGMDDLVLFMDPDGHVTVPQGSRVKELIDALPPAPVGAPVLPLLAIRRSDITALIDAYEAVKAERDEWKASSAMYEKTAAEGVRGLECLSDIDEAWDAFGSAGNRGALTLAEQIASLTRDAEAAEARVAELTEALEWAVADIEGRANYESGKQRQNAIERARAALAGKEEG